MYISDVPDNATVMSLATETELTLSGKELKEQWNTITDKSWIRLLHTQPNRINLDRVIDFILSNELYMTNEVSRAYHADKISEEDKERLSSLLHDIFNKEGMPVMKSMGDYITDDPI